jgi:hypothetical protein
MATTNLNKTLTVMLSAKLGSGDLLERKFTVANVNEISRRILTVPTSESDIILFSNEVSAGTFLSNNLKFAAICNLDDTNFVRIRKKKVFSNRLASLGSLTVGAVYANGTYSNIPLIGTGTGATATIVVAGTAIRSLGGITGGTGYVDGSYSNVNLTGSTGSGAIATVTVAGGIVTSVILISKGVSYTANTNLSASNSQLGGTGTGFLVQLLTIGGGVSSVTLVLKGIGYTVGSTLTVDNSLIGNGTGFSILVNTVDTVSEISDEKLEAGKFIVLGNTKLNVDELNGSFNSFSDIESVSAQADTLPVDLELYIASI